MSKATPAATITHLKATSHYQPTVSTAYSRRIGEAVRATTEMKVSLNGTSVYHGEVGALKDYGITIIKPTGEMLTLTTGHHARRKLRAQETVWNVKTGESTDQLVEEIIEWINEFDSEQYTTQVTESVIKMFDAAATAEEAYALKGTLPEIAARAAVTLYVDAKGNPAQFSRSSRNAFVAAWESCH